MLDVLRFVVADQVHLVDGEHDVADADQVRQVAVAPRLRQHALARVDEDDGKIGGRGAGDHVARVLLMAGRVGDDELALVGGEEAVGDVDGDALFALGRQAVDQQRKVDVLALGADALAVGLERRQLVLEDHLRVVQQPADERRLAVVDAAAGDEAQQRLVLVLHQVGIDVRGDQRGRLVAVLARCWRLALPAPLPLPVAVPLPLPPLKSNPPASSSPCWPPGRGRWRGPGARRWWSAAFP